MSNLSDEIILEPDTKRIRVDDDDEEKEDRLSNLPDCLILHILSFCNSVYAVRTCILSTRWKHLWKRLPILVLHSHEYPHFSTLKRFDKFVPRIMSLRDDSIALRTFDFGRYGSSEPHILRKIASYVLSHSSQLHRLGLSVIGDSSLILPCISSCHALTYLKLSVYPKGRYTSGATLFPKSLNFPALTTLHLTNFAFCVSDNVGRAEPFSAFNSLNSLILCSCALQDAQILSISSATLVNLTIDRWCSGSSLPKIELSAPSLATFTCSGTPKHKLCGSTLSSVNQVNIDASMYSASEESPLILLSWLRDLPNIKSLTVTSHALLVLCLDPNLFKVNFPYLCNLKSLKVKMERLQLEECICLEFSMLKNKSRKEASKIKKAFKAGLEPSATIPDRIVDFLLQNSPSAKVDIIKC